MVKWQKFTQTDKDVLDYHRFLEFLDLRATSTELTSYNSGPKKSHIPYKKQPKLNPPGDPNPVFSYAAQTQGKFQACSGPKHNIAYCSSFKDKTVADKRNLILEQGLCFNCLKRKHLGKQCPSNNCCLKCGKRHHTLLHLNYVEGKPEGQKQDAPVPPTPSVNSNNETTNAASTSGTTAATYVTTPHQMVARALLDPASTACFVTERIAQQLMLRSQKRQFNINGIGETHCPNQSNTVTDINLNSMWNKSSVNHVQAIVLPSLTKRLPITSLQNGYWPHLSSLELADPRYNQSKTIDVLLGVDVYQDIFKPGLILGPRETPAAQESIFGWVLFGSSNGQQPVNEVTILHASVSIPSCEETLQKFCSLEEPPKANLTLSPLDKFVAQAFDQRHKRDESGCF